MPQLVQENPPPRELLNVPREVLVRLVAPGSLDELPEGQGAAGARAQDLPGRFITFPSCRCASPRCSGATCTDPHPPTPTRPGKCRSDTRVLRCPSVPGRPTRLPRSPQRGQELAEKISTRSVLNNGSAA